MRSHRRSPLDLWLTRRVFEDGAVAFNGTPPSIQPPPMTASFPSIGENESSWAPADASGAVGPAHVVAVTNAGMVVQQRTGERLATVPLNLFMGTSIGDTRDLYFDPRIVYDAANDRWIVTCLRDGLDLMIAVSQSGDPLGAWNRYRLPASTLQVSELDFMQLVLTRDTIVVASSDWELARFPVLSIAKADAYSAPATLPLTLHSLDYFVVPVTNEDSAIEYAMIGFQIVIRLGDRRWRTVQIPECCESPWRAPQLGSSDNIDTGLFLTDSAVLRNGAIHAVGSVSIGTTWGGPRYDAIQWTKFDPETGRLIDSGRIEDPTGEMFYAYPSVAVNRSGVMVIGFSTFSMKQYPSAGYAYRDALGRVSTVATIKSGNTSYVRALDNGTQRWGDYTATVLDPLSNNAFWTFQIVALDTHWVTWWAKVETSASTRRHAVRH